MFFSVVTPTYNRRPILEKCLRALERQQLAAENDYEILLVDDGSTDGTVRWLQQHTAEFPHVRLFCQNHQGPGTARNLGIKQAIGDTIVFVDDDVIVTEHFLQAHGDALQQGQQQLGNTRGSNDTNEAHTQNSTPRLFTCGRLINTNNFDNPTAEPYKLTDFSMAYFATANVAIARTWLEQAGLFDTRFQLYGWEDLELGVRLKQLGLKLVQAPDAVGYHWKPTFSLDQIPRLIDQEIQRGRMGALFYCKHSTWEVRMMIQMTWLHRLLWGLLSLGGRLNERTLAPLLQWLIQQGRPQLASEIARVFLNWYNVQGVYAAYAKIQQSD